MRKRIVQDQPPRNGNRHSLFALVKLPIKRPPGGRIAEEKTFVALPFKVSGRFPPLPAIQV